MRLGFYGTPEVSARYLRALADAHEIVAVVTQPDRPRGRRGAPQPSPVKELAIELGVPVLQPEPGECEEVCSRVEGLDTELCVVVAFGQKLPCGTSGRREGRAVNVHYSLLPKLRGAAPVQHAILQGLEQTGVTIQYVALELDEGDIILQRVEDIQPEDTCGTLTERLTTIGVDALLEALELIAAGKAERWPQDPSAATFAPVLKKADGIVDWREPAELIARKVRAFNPWPGARTELRGKPLTLLEARADRSIAAQGGVCGRAVEITRDALAVSCEGGLLWLEKVQAAGKKPMPIADFLCGARLEVGEEFTNG